MFRVNRKRMQVWVGFVRACIGLAALLCGGSVLAQIPTGEYPEAYLRRDVGARAIGMGGAYTAVVNEPSAVHYNPAGLAFSSQRPQITGMYTVLDFGREHNYLGYAQNFDNVVGVGVGVNNYFAGSFTARDVSGAPLGTYSNQQLAVQGAFAIRSKAVGLGVTGKYLLNTLKGPNIRGDGWGIDIGMKLQLPGILSAGLTAQNIAGEMSWNNEAGNVEKLAYTIRAGVALEFDFAPVVTRRRGSILGDVSESRMRSDTYALLALDAVFSENDARAKFMIGAEIAPVEVLAFRFGMSILNDDIENGYRWLPFNEFGGGFSVKILDDELPASLQLDYAFSKDYITTGDLSHHISLIAEF